ncbi:hypothetical protein BOX15_Mlig023423g1 [Macrostomum lignano]|uniref:Innexin n=1 Tax=Macrostomum lignano TaxID=282301 RepID=A0A267GSI1_9PLAT|nr:hypothetical protein BOX15_Mlig023423g1 [Macrostomum lignano]
MVVHDFISAAGKMELLTHVGLDDFADRLNCLFTVCFLMVFSCATTIKTYFLNPIFCYLPNIVGSHEGQSAYVNNYCYTEGTYNVPLEDFKIDNTKAYWDEEFRSRKIYYYQWLPFLLGVQGIIFCIPRFTWQLLVTQRAGTDLFQLVRVACDAGRADGEKREKLRGHVTRQLELWLFNTRELSSSPMKQTRRRLYGFLSCCVASKRLGTWLVFCYFVIKCAYIVNLICQLLLMCHVLQVKSSRSYSGSLLWLTSTFGLDLLSELAQGRDWQDTGLFPGAAPAPSRLARQPMRSTSSPSAPCQST